ncbi:hypothetical protein UB43_07490 [Pseudomonas sp. 21]|uniref:hypothetical protein n=1 Tax=unclassified Pseudomonas TaxID=196821 RepID=UPI0005EB27B1|nr:MULTISPECIES: hypothetical protein [unclassified Pseudomonas]KJK01881.1 hypothetical protein UB43_07490 [Pseudomonas sp. 21]MBV7582554.1 hypothetical protein [Pseudomonas sp. PDM33]
MESAITEFTPVTSRRRLMPSMVVSVLGIVVLMTPTVLALFLAGFSFLEASDSNAFDDRVGAVFLGLITALLMAVIGWNIRRTGIYQQVQIDESGVHCLGRGGRITREFLWSDFTPSPSKRPLGLLLQSDVDVLLGLQHDSMKRLIWWYRGQKVIGFVFAGNFLFHNFSANSDELHRAFLLGLTRYRPDLSISPAVFALYSISPDSLHRPGGISPAAGPVKPQS